MIEFRKNVVYISKEMWNDFLYGGNHDNEAKTKPKLKKMTLQEKLEYRKNNYPEKCARCKGPLAGPGTDEEIMKQIKEHDELFGEDAPITTSEVICDDCFQVICPGGNLIGFS